MNLNDYVVFRDSGTRTVDRYLMPHEGQTIAVRRHPAVLLRPVVEVVAGLFACGYVSTATGLTLIWWLWLGLLARLMWKVFAWSIEYFLVTEHRVMLITGVLNRRVAMIPLGKVTDIALERSALGRMLGYGEFVMESAGQDQAMRNVKYMPYPEQLYLEVSSLVFPAVDGSPD
ncbi:MAG: rane-flanked domain protein [Actinomycetia bacterium]|jgi:uncharacterized membrane protein YdbT with pleckstrin-like domain|nr:rane-flanked domain protein [Actinomycetes bacterium]